MAEDNLAVMDSCLSEDNLAVMASCVLAENNLAVMASCVLAAILAAEDNLAVMASSCVLAAILAEEDLAVMGRILAEDNLAVMASSCLSEARCFLLHDFSLPVEAFSLGRQRGPGDSEASTSALARENGNQATPRLRGPDHRQGEPLSLRSFAILFLSSL